MLRGSCLAFLLMTLALAGGAPTVLATTGSPVILVHGWHGAGPEDSLDASSLALLSERLLADGHAVVWADGVAVDPSATLFDSADALAEVVRRTARQYPGQSLSLIGHSYGGLVARALLETERYERLRLEGHTVSNLVTLGTPMAGIDLWLPLLFVLGDPLGEPSVWELTPAWMSQFNRHHRPRPDVRYTLIAGDARSQVPPLWLLPASDGAVTVASAHALPERTLGLTELTTRDVHSSTDYGRLLRWRSLVDNVDTYQRLIRPGLMAAGKVRPAALATERDPVMAPSQPEPPDTVAEASAPAPARGGFTHTPWHDLVLAPGEVREVAPPVDRSVGLLVSGEAGILLDLVGVSAPTATESPRSDPAERHWLTSPAERLGLWGALVSAPGGAYRLRLENTHSMARRVAWLGILPHHAPHLAVSASVSSDELVIQLAADRPGLRLAHLDLTTQYGRRHEVTANMPVVPGAPGDQVRAAVLDRPRSGVYYLQATATLDGWNLQTELTVTVDPDQDIH